MDENNKFDVVGTNTAEKATMIWNVKDFMTAYCRRIKQYLKSMRK